VVKYPKGLKAPHVRNTAMQLQVKADCFQMEFGMMAGLFKRSCRIIQNTNVGSKAIASERSAIFAGS
jgi:hypothetical protein